MLVATVYILVIFPGAIPPLLPQESWLRRVALRLWLLACPESGARTTECDYFG